MNTALIRFILSAALVIYPAVSRAMAGADVPWTTYEAEDMKTTGTVMGPKYEPFHVETESSGQRCIQLNNVGDYVEFTATVSANGLVLRYSLPDSVAGGGLNSTISLYQNGKLVKMIPLTSHYSWVYGDYPFNNFPTNGRPRNLYNEARVKDLKISKGDVLRLQKAREDPANCIVDLVDLEKIPSPLKAPKNSISLNDFGAAGTGETDDTMALRHCIIAAREQKKTVWIPSGTYKLTGDIICESGVTIQGAGMWHTIFVGDENLYNQADKRVRFKLKGSDIHLADFAIIGKLTYRNDDEPNDGIHGAGCDHCTVARIWVEHTKVGMWFYNGANVLVEGCRMRNTLADGINLCVGCRNFLIENCSTRGTGDDCFAIWPTVSDQGYTEQAPEPGSNVIRHCTGQVPFLANGGAIYGGKSNRIEDCLFQDIAPGCGILLSTTFPTSDTALKRDNNFSGTTVVRNCEVVRSGGYDMGWGWRAAVQLCLDRRSISGLDISNLTIKDSLSDGFGVVAPGSMHQEGTLERVQVENMVIPNCSIATSGHHGVSIRADSKGGLTMSHSQVVDTQNSSPDFRIVTE